MIADPSVMYADPERQAQAARTLLGWMAYEYPMLAAVFADAAVRVPGDDARTFAALYQQVAETSVVTR